MTKHKSLGRRILLAMTALVIGMLIVAGGIFALTMKKASNTLAEANRDLSETIGEKSWAYMTDESQSRMLELAKEKAKIADQLFLEFERGVSVAASPVVPQTARALTPAFSWRSIKRSSMA